MKSGIKVLIGIVGSYLGIIIYCVMGIQFAKTSIPDLYCGIIEEVFLTIVAVLLIIILKRNNNFKFDKEGLKTEYKCAIPSFIIISYSAIGFIIGILLLGRKHYEGVAVSTIIFNLILCLILSALVGFAEEALFRGIIFNELRDFWGRNSLKAVYLAAVISSILFGCTHLTNLIKGADFIGVLVQIISAGISGLAYCAIYYRTNNLWAPIFLHGYNDFVGYITSGMLSGGSSAADVVSKYQFEPIVLVMPIVELSVALFILRKKKVEPLLNRE